GAHEDHATADHPYGQRYWYLFNEFYDCDAGIRVQTSDYIYIVGNEFHDMHPSYAMIGPTRNVAYSTGGCLQMWKNRRVYFVNNLCYDTPHGVLLADYNPNAVLTMANNIIGPLNSEYYDEFGVGGWHVHVRQPHMANNSFLLNNLMYQNGDPVRVKWSSLPEDLPVYPARDANGNFRSDPLWVDAASGNFNLQPGSPAMDNGAVSDVYQTFIDLYGIDLRKDIQGKARPQGAAWDIGAYEYTIVAVNDLAVSKTSQNSVTLSWTVPGEQAVTGPPDTYDIRYTDSPITQANWETATQVSGEPVPGSFGEAQSFTVTRLQPGTTYYFAIKVLDEVGHFSELSNVVSGITATSGNHAPVLNVGDRSAVERVELRFAVDATDADAGDTLIYSAPYYPVGAVFTAGTRTFTWTPTTEQIGVHYATFAVTDGSVTVWETVKITVLSGGNHPPVLAPIGNKSVNENVLLSFTISATDIDGQDIIYSASGLPSGAAFDPATRTFTWTPTFDQAGTYNNVTFSVNDGHVTVSETITITVVNVNRPPVLASIGPKSVNENALLSFSVSGTDPDGDSLNYATTPLPTGASFANRVFSWLPAYDQAGSYSVTFTVSDGGLTASEPITISVVHVSDRTPPVAHSFYPAADAFQAPVNPVLTLAISDTGLGVQADTVSIRVQDRLVYAGDSTLYTSPDGICRRAGSSASYRYYFFPNDPFNFDQQVSVLVTASDRANNVMAPVSYQFATMMQSFGRNEPVSAGDVPSGRPATATDSQGNIWLAWHAGPAGARNIYIAKRDCQTQQWGSPVVLTSLGSDQCRPTMAVDAGDRLYVAWQDNRRGNWDILLSTSPDGIQWQDALRVTDSNDNQINPVIAVDHAVPPRAYLAWEDDSAGNQDIYLASSNTLFASKTTTQVTSQAADQTEPVLAVASGNTAYLVWTDRRTGTADIYGASSASAWANVPIVTGAGNQSSPALAVEPGTSVLHLLWVDDAADHARVLYATSAGLPGSPISGVPTSDDTGDQFTPAIVAVQDYRDIPWVYACWQDHRSVASSGDNDLYFVEIRSGIAGTNVLVGDDGTNSDQSEPALGCDEYGQPVILWTDSRGSAPRIYSAGTTYFHPVPWASGTISLSTGGRIGPDPASIADHRDVSISIPANAYGCDLPIAISQIRNPPQFGSRYRTGCEIGPSGIHFLVPVTVTIPYPSSASERAVPYWYDAQTGTLSQQGITNVVHRDLGTGLSALSFNTMHLTAFCVMEGSVNGVSGGGGGCALARSHDGRMGEFFLPYAALVLCLFALKTKDRRYKGM
ncbi:MAG: hypothetical protein FJ280_22970, partial [Planctomycetes bacterium]|nr:hypothetical protein [Planctomycetota bacterium]